MFVPVLIAATLASTIKAFAGSVIRPASDAFVDWALPNVKEVRRMTTNAATRRNWSNLTFETGLRETNAGFQLLSNAGRVMGE